MLRILELLLSPYYRKAEAFFRSRKYSDVVGEANKDTTGSAVPLAGAEMAPKRNCLGLGPGMELSGIKSRLDFG